MNLVLNAKDAMIKGGMITIHTWNVNKEESPFKDNHGVPSGKLICMSISDTGMGIDEKIINKSLSLFSLPKRWEKVLRSGCLLSMVL